MPFLGKVVQSTDFTSAPWPRSHFDGRVPKAWWQMSYRITERKDSKESWTSPGNAWICVQNSGRDMIVHVPGGRRFIVFLICFSYVFHMLKWIVSPQDLSSPLPEVGDEIGVWVRGDRGNEGSLYTQFEMHERQLWGRGHSWGHWHAGTQKPKWGNLFEKMKGKAKSREFFMQFLSVRSNSVLNMKSSTSVALFESLVFSPPHNESSGCTSITFS